jgi:predicted  nucleic acid-binding Zn-ribbon protein
MAMSEKELREEIVFKKEMIEWTEKTISDLKETVEIFTKRIPEEKRMLKRQKENLKKLEMELYALLS